MTLEGVTKDGEIIPVSTTLGLRGRVLQVGWELPADLSEQEWKQAGGILGKVERSVSWWVGDWWNFGERYGDRVEIVQAPDWDGPGHEVSRNVGSIAGKFHVSRRRDTLSFNHHAEVAALPPEEADALLYELVDECWGIRNVEYGRSAPHLREAFTLTLARLLTDHTDFWKGSLLTVESQLRTKLASFPLQDPEIKRLSASAGQARKILYLLIRNHINSGKRTRRINPRETASDLARE